VCCGAGRGTTTTTTCAPPTGTTTTPTTGTTTTASGVSDRFRCGEVRASGPELGALALDEATMAPSVPRKRAPATPVWRELRMGPRGPASSRQIANRLAACAVRAHAARQSCYDAFRVQTGGALRCGSTAISLSPTGGRKRFLKCCPARDAAAAERSAAMCGRRAAYRQWRTSKETAVSAAARKPPKAWRSTALATAMASGSSRGWQHNTVASAHARPAARHHTPSTCAGRRPLTWSTSKLPAL